MLSVTYLYFSESSLQSTLPGMSCMIMLKDLIRNFLKPNTDLYMYVVLKLFQVVSPCYG